ncbi:MAG: hypothetical protein IPJ41_14795 [Phycisphaerales bacterium]|nr:hypothetical protein [Phycisphaerales bacterium]
MRAVFAAVGAVVFCGLAFDFRATSEQGRTGLAVAVLGVSLGGAVAAAMLSFCFVAGGADRPARPIGSSSPTGSSSPIGPAGS